VAKVQRDAGPYKQIGVPSRRSDSAKARSRLTPMSVTYLDAIREAQARRGGRSARVYLRQDVGAFGGAFKARRTWRRNFPGA